MKTKKSPVTPERILQLSWGYSAPLIIEAALHHRVFDALDGGPKTVPQLVRTTGASARGLTAICNALVGLQLLSHHDGHYRLTPESATFLVSHKPAYHGAFYRHISRQLIPKWLELSEIVRTGRPVRRVNRNGDGAQFFVEFVESLFPLSYAAARAFGEHLQLNKIRNPVSVLDLAAGSGVWGIALAQLSNRVRVTAVDWPEVLQVTRRVAQRHGVADRLETVGGDLLTADFGKGHRVATLGHILHSEGPVRSRKLLRRTFQALAPGGTIAVMEFLVDADRQGPPVGLLFAVNMLVNTEAGDTFSFEEISRWLKSAGFVRPRMLQVPAVSPLVLATKPG